ncbi:MAG: prohibitin family protein [Oscillospiraceae bacterium]|nr:prohibitin family protein [Oscillospiraceae bacterium]
MSNMFSTDNNNNGKSPSFKTGWLAPAVTIIVIIILALNCFTLVSEGFIGVKFRLEKIVTSELKPGLNLKIPFIERIEQIDTRNQIYEFAGDAYTKDTQKVNELRLKVTYRYSQDRLSGLIRDVGIMNIQDRFLVPNVQKISKDEIGRVNAESLVQTRGEVQSRIQEKLTTELAKEGIIVTAFAIENLAFESQFEESIQAKVIAEQKALQMINITREKEEQAKQVVIAAEAEAESVLVKAEAEAQAIALIQEQIGRNAGYIEYLKIINWDGILPQVIGDGVNPFVVIGDTDRISAATNNQSADNAE